jgi:hypothetical protein
MSYYSIVAWIAIVGLGVLSFVWFVVKPLLADRLRPWVSHGMDRLASHRRFEGWLAWWHGPGPPPPPPAYTEDVIRGIRWRWRWGEHREVLDLAPYCVKDACALRLERVTRLDAEGQAPPCKDGYLCTGCLAMVDSPGGCEFFEREVAKVVERNLLSGIRGDGPEPRRWLFEGD